MELLVFLHQVYGFLTSGLICGSNDRLQKMNKYEPIFKCFGEMLNKGETKQKKGQRNIYLLKMMTRVSLL